MRIDQLSLIYYTICFLCIFFKVSIHLNEIITDNINITTFNNNILIIYRPIYIPFPIPNSFPIALAWNLMMREILCSNIKKTTHRTVFCWVYMSKYIYIYIYIDCCYSCAAKLAQRQRGTFFLVQIIQFRDYGFLWWSGMIRRARRHIAPRWWSLSVSEKIRTIYAIRVTKTQHTECQRKVLRWAKLHTFINTNVYINRYTYIYLSLKPFSLAPTPNNHNHFGKWFAIAQVLLCHSVYLRNIAINLWMFFFLQPHLCVVGHFPKRICYGSV